MSLEITNAHICGPLGQALALVDGESMLFEVDRGPRRPTHNEIRVFFDHGLEVRPLQTGREDALTRVELEQALEKEAHRFRALRGALAGMDPEVEEELRRRLMRQSEALLGDPEVEDFVTTRLLRPLDSAVWTLPLAQKTAHAEALPLLERAYSILEGPLLKEVENAISAWAKERGSNSLENAMILEDAFTSGLVRTLATLIHDQGRTGPQQSQLHLDRAEWNPDLVTYLSEHFAATDSAELLQADGEESAIAPDGDRAQVVAAGDAVLIVDSEEIFRKLSARVLKVLGYRVLEATSAKSAIDWIEHDSSITVLITDDFLEGDVDGLGLIQWAAEHCPNIRSILLSEFLLTPPNAERSPGRFQLVKKPLHKDQLVKAINRGRVS